MDRLLYDFLMRRRDRQRGSHKTYGVSGVSELLRTLHYLQVLRRHNEAIALDYAIPFQYGRRRW